MATKKPSAPGKSTKAEPKSAATKATPNKAAAAPAKDTKATTKSVAAKNPAPKAAETKATETKTAAVAETKTTKVAKEQEVSTTAVASTKQKVEKRIFTPEEVALKAYFNWINRGYTHGGDVHDWLHAEAELNQLN
jgi:predicted peptidase